MENIDIDRELGMENGKMDKYKIESKLYVEPGKGKRLLKMILNLILVGSVLLTLFQILMDGFSITRIGELCVVILVVAYYNEQIKPGYQFSLLDLEIGSEKVRFVYHAVKIGSRTENIQYEISTNRIDKIEYSKQLNAIRFAGELYKTINGKTRVEKELVVYCHNEAYQVIASLEKRLDCKVTILE